MKKYKKRRRRSDNSVDDWLMTYADMITLLLCFFAIFLSISVPQGEQMKTARQRLKEHFASGDTVEGKIHLSESVSKTPDSTESGLYRNLPSIVDQFEQGRKQTIGVTSDEPETGKPYKKDPPPPGDRIVTFEMPSAAFFASGSADLSEEGKKLLQEIIDQKLNLPEFQDYQITVEGHTDDEPINTPQFPSNWELSTARSAAVVRFFIEQGIIPQRLRAAGYADSIPKAPNRDSEKNAISENQAQNRRVVIKLEKIQKLY